MVHGHIHKNRSMEFWPLLRANPNILNAGVDINNYEPVSFEELLRNNERFKNEQDPKVMEK
jgi:calcineurin-like phosphoesterase family protein